jgi:hypothetical protein
MESILVLTRRFESGIIDDVFYRNKYLLFKRELLIQRGHNEY